MRLKQFDLNRLTILWQSSIHNINLRNEIEQELWNKILNNEKYSREYLFGLCKISKQAISVSFIPTSVAYKNYGQYIIIDILLEETQMKEIIKNHTSKPPISTFGQIKANALVTDNLNSDQIELLKNFGFHTNEILGVLVPVKI